MSGESKPNDWPSSKFRPKKSRLKWAAFFWRCIGDNFLSSRETAPETKYVIFQGANIAPRFSISKHVETFKANPENARKIFGSVPERTKLSSLAGTQGGDAGKYAAKSWDELDRAGLLAELKANHPDLYEKKYKEMAASLHICRG